MDMTEVLYYLSPAPVIAGLLQTDAIEVRSTDPTWVKSEKSLATRTLLYTAAAVAFTASVYFFKDTYPVFFGKEAGAVFTLVAPNGSAFYSGSSLLYNSLATLYSTGFAQDNMSNIKHVVLVALGYLGISWGGQRLLDLSIKAISGQSEERKPIL